MRVIDVLRTFSADEWVRFVDFDAKEPRNVWSKRMKLKNITWDRLRRIEWKYVHHVNYSPDGCLIIRYSAKKSIYDC